MLMLMSHCGSLVAYAYAYACVASEDQALKPQNFFLGFFATQLLFHNCEDHFHYSILYSQCICMTRNMSYTHYDTDPVTFSSCVKMKHVFFSLVI